MKLIETDIVIEGNPYNIDMIKNQLGKPVYVFKEYGLGLASEPIFSLWNIARPDKEDYDSYFKLDSNKSWFAWNLYNWGTMYDCMNFDGGEELSILYDESVESLKYKILTPNSKPIRALETLSFYNRGTKISWN
jgi:hypothetical protein